MITNSESIRVWKDTAVAYLKIFPQQSAGDTKKKKLQSEYTEDRERFEPGASHIQALQS
jgi:hypothetical protein